MSEVESDAVGSYGEFALMEKSGPLNHLRAAMSPEISKRLLDHSGMSLTDCQGSLTGINGAVMMLSRPLSRFLNARDTCPHGLS